MYNYRGMNIQTPQQAARFLAGMFSQEEIRQLTGVNQPTFSRILTGVHRNPRWDTAWPIVRLAMQQGATTEQDAQHEKGFAPGAGNAPENAAGHGGTAAQSCAA